MQLTKVRSSFSEKGIGLLVLMVLLTSVAGVATSQEYVEVPEVLHFSIQDPDGKFFPRGEAEFCTRDGDCVFADIDPGFPGQFFIRSEDLVPNVEYTVFFYDPEAFVRYEMRGWVFKPAEYDPVWDPAIKNYRFLIFPRFQGQKDRALTFSIGTSFNPDWERRSGRAMAFTDADSISAYPEFIVSGFVPVMLGGKFGSDKFAAGGVSSVKPGIGVSALFRSKYRDRGPVPDHWISFREFSFTYAQNRYQTMELMTPGRQSDVIFHRLTCAYGIGQINPDLTKHWSVAAAVGYGGIFDSSEALQYLDRTYTMPAAGLQARFFHVLFMPDRVSVGLTFQVDLMYYFADELRDDFWYGFAPSVSFGLVVF